MLRFNATSKPYNSIVVQNPDNIQVLETPVAEEEVTE